MMIIVHRDGQSFGPYTQSDLATMVSSGKFHCNDFAWNDRDRIWGILTDVLTPPPSVSQIMGYSSAPENAKSQGYLVSSKGQTYGPLSESELKDSYTLGKLERTDLVWSHTSKSWITLAEVLEVNQPRQAVSSSLPLPPQKVASKNIIINNGGQNYGPYTSDQVREFVRWGIFQTKDFAWSELTNTWISLVELLQTSPLPVVPPTPMVPYVQPTAMPPLQVQFAPPIQSQYLEIGPMPSPPKSGRSVSRSKAKVIIISGGRKYGPYSPSQSLEFLRSGKFQENDFAWSDTQNSWRTLGEVMDELQPHARKGHAHRATSTIPQVPQAHAQVVVYPQAGPIQGGAYTPNPVLAPMQIQQTLPQSSAPNPVATALNRPYIERTPSAPKRRNSAASVISATSKNYGPSF